MMLSAALVRDSENPSWSRVQEFVRPARDSKPLQIHVGATGQQLESGEAAVSVAMAGLAVCSGSVGVVHGIHCGRRVIHCHCHHFGGRTFRGHRYGSTDASTAPVMAAPEIIWA